MQSTDVTWLKSGHNDYSLNHGHQDDMSYSDNDIHAPCYINQLKNLGVFGGHRVRGRNRSMDIFFIIT